MDTVSPIDSDLTDSEFTQLANKVYEHCGINLRDGKQDMVRARLAKQTRLGKFASSHDYLRHVLADDTGKEFRGLIDAVSTNLTSFFRESAHFDFLERKYLPVLLAKKRKLGNMQLRAWSAGCSSGEEAYSLAITLLGATQGGAGWDMKLLATDISTRVLTTARRGTYDDLKAQTIPAQFRDMYFSAARAGRQTSLEAKPVLKNMIAFRHLNLMDPWPFCGPFDFIFCRNVMIYFDKPTQANLIRRFKQTLAPGGILFTGHSESLAGIDHGMKYVQPTIYANP